MRFNQDFIERVRESVNIVDVISRYTQLKRSGHQRYTGLCPFHSERTPSFSVSEQMQMYHCFGCKKGGNVYTFVQDIQGLSFPEAVEFLAQQAGLRIPDDAYEKGALPNREKGDRKKQFFRINEIAANFFHHNLLSLPATHKVRDYLKARGIRDETIKQFRLGYAPDSWDSLLNALTVAKISHGDAEALGLIKARSGDKSGHYDLFRDRLMFPITAPAGQILGFGGRILGEGQPKYLNSPESEVFHKGRIFYGIDQSAKFIRGSDRVIVVEGYMDYLALFQAGIQDVVATLGTALTPDHGRALKRHTKNIIVLFDGDAAGKEAAERSLPILLSEGLLPRGLTLPDELDPDEFLEEHGPQALEEALKSSPELFALVLVQQLTDFRAEPAQQVAVMDHMQPILESVSDPRLRSLYLRQLAERLRVSPQWVQEAVKGKLGSAAVTTNVPNKSLRPTIGAPPSAASNSPEVAEGVSQDRDPGIGGGEAVVIRVNLKTAPASAIQLINVALMKEKYFQMVRESGELDHLADEGLRRLWQRIVELCGQMPNKFDRLTAQLINQVDPPGAVSLHLSKPLSELQDRDAEKLIQDHSRYLKNQRAHRESQEILRKIRSGEIQDEKLALEQIMNIHRDRQVKDRENA